MNALDIREAKGEITIVGLTSVEVINLREGISYLAEGIRVVVL